MQWSAIDVMARSGLGEARAGFLRLRDPNFTSLPVIHREWQCIGRISHDPESALRQHGSIDLTREPDDGIPSENACGYPTDCRYDIGHCGGRAGSRAFRAPECRCSATRLAVGIDCPGARAAGADDAQPALEGTGITILRQLVFHEHHD